MERRVWNKTVILALAGILSNIIALAIVFVPQQLEGKQLNLAWSSPQGVTVIALVVINVSLLVVGIVMKERHLSLRDKTALVHERQHTLSRLQDSIARRLRIARTLETKAEKLPLSQYWERYLKNTYPYIVRSNRPQNPTEIVSALARKRFVWNNLYYAELKEEDGNYKRSVDTYHIEYSKLDERATKALEKRLRWLWTSEHSCTSAQIYAAISMGNKKVTNVPMGYRGGLWGKHKTVDAFQQALVDVQRDISKLKEGIDLL
jgi:hypothetical protein